MNKKISLYLAGIIAELLLFFSGIALTGRNDLFWIMPAVSFVGMGITVILTCREYETLLNERSDRLCQNRKNELDEFAMLFGELNNEIQTKNSNIEQMLCSLSDTAHSNSESVSRMREVLSDYQKNTENNISALTELINKNSVKYQKTTAAMCEDIKSGLDELRTIESEQNQKFADETANSISGLADTLNANSEKINSHILSGYEQLKNMTEEQYKSLVGYSDEVSEKVKELVAGLSAIPAIVEQTVSKNSELTADYINYAEQKYEKLTHSFSETVSAASQKAVSDAVSELCDVYEKTSHQISEKTEECFKKFDISYKSALDGVTQKLYEDNKTTNKQLLQSLSETETEHSDTLRKTFDEISLKHTQAISDTICSGIRSIRDENKAISEQIGNFISSENSFVDSAEKKFTDTLGLIENASALYQDSFEKVKGLVSNYTGNIKDTVGEQLQSVIAELNSCSTEITGRQTEELNKSMKIISGEFAELSAKAIASVQEKNNEHICKIADSLTELGESTKSLSNEWREADKSIRNDMDEISARISESADRQSETNSHLVSDLRIAIDEKITRLDELIDAKIAEGTNALQSSVSGYTEEFVNANAEALASIQKDNLDKIRDAGDNVTKLAGEILKFINNTKQFYSELRNMLQENAENQNDTLNDFNTDFQKKINKLNQILTEKTEEHYSESKEIQTQIQTITSNYERMFNQIMENQKNMQAMTESDINLLTKLLK